MLRWKIMKQYGNRNWLITYKKIILYFAFSKPIYIVLELVVLNHGSGKQSPLSFGFSHKPLLASAGTLPPLESHPSQELGSGKASTSTVPRTATSRSNATALFILFQFGNNYDLPHYGYLSQAIQSHFLNRDNTLYFNNIYTVREKAVKCLYFCILETCYSVYFFLVP